jgi:uncharacterized protein (TIGR00730 family)
MEAFMASVSRQFMLLVRVVWDFVKGMYAFGLVEPCVTVFGSARLKHNEFVYQTARILGKALGQNGFTIMTGGGPGLMEAANLGAREAGTRSFACRIQLPFEQSANHNLDRYVTFRYFFVRKVMMLRCSCALVVLPGGFGTFDELFEVLTLIQTKKIDPLPIVFIGKTYWQPLFHIFERMVSAGTISATDMNLVMGRTLITDDVSEAIAHIKAYSSYLFQLRGLPPPRARSSSGDIVVSVEDTHS